MIYIGSKICYIHKKRPNLQLTFNGWEHHDYLSHMSFFSMCGFDHRKDMGEAWGSSRYLPITH